MRPTWKKIYHPDGRREVCPDGYRNVSEFVTFCPPPPTDIWEKLPQYLLDNYLEKMRERYDGARIATGPEYRRMVLGDADTTNPSGFQMGDGPG